MAKEKTKEHFTSFNGALQWIKSSIEQTNPDGSWENKVESYLIRRAKGKRENTSYWYVIESLLEKREVA